MYSKHFASVDILLVIRACAEQYPPTVNQANLLAKSGLRVGLVRLTSGKPTGSDLSPAIKQWTAHQAWDSKKESVPSFERRWFNWMRFSRTCRNAIQYGDPRIVIGYDIAGCAHLKPRSDRRKTIYHFHELPEREPGMGVGQRLGLRKVRQWARNTDVVVFSDSMRANYYQKEAKLMAAPRTVMNCPARMQTLLNSQLRVVLGVDGGTKTRIVCYLGSIGTNQGLPEAALSMRYWPPNAIFVLIGPPPENVKQKILTNANSVKAGARIFFLGPKLHREALALAAGADVGLSLIQPNNMNLLFSSGAINKRFEYMALGVPQVTNSSPGVFEIMDKDRCGLSVNPSCPEAIGSAVKRLLSDENLSGCMGQHGRKLHLTLYNYETQFAPLLEWIAVTMNRKRDDKSTAR